LWDTWIAEDAGTFYLFYLRISAHGTVWDGISIATSTDLVHFQEAGTVMKKSPEANWLGTGSVTRVGSRWVMNFSEELPGSPPDQTIRFAESERLAEGWKRVDDVVFRPDPAYYESARSLSAEPVARWDCISVARVPGRAGGELLGYLTANARDALPGASGCVGLAESDDAIHWNALPPPLEPGLFSNCEVVEHVQFGPRHYLLFSSNTAAGIRYDSRSRANSGGTYYVVSDRPAGPFALPPGDPLLQGSRSDRNVFSLYVGRPFRHPDGTLLYSHHWASENRPPNGSWGPIKTLREVRPWQLGLGWWKGNEALRGPLLARYPDGGALRQAHPLGQARVCLWHPNDDPLRVENRGGCSVAQWDVLQGPVDASDGGLASGRILETGVLIESGAALGIWWGTVRVPELIDGPVPGLGPKREDYLVAVLLNCETRRVEFVRLMRSIGPSHHVQAYMASIEWPVAAGVTHRVRSLVRGEFMEIYIDDWYVHGVSAAEGFDVARVGFAVDRASGEFPGAELRQMR
jgi:hypothetical protein